MKVVGVSEDKNWAFVENSETGVPMSQLTVFDQLLPESNPITPPINPLYKPPQKPEIKAQEAEPKKGFASERCTLDEGPVLLSWPDELTADSVEEFEYWLNGVIKRARRKAGLSTKGHN